MFDIRYAGQRHIWRLLQSSAYVFNTNGWLGVDISLRSAAILTNTQLTAELFAKCRLMIISTVLRHFEEITVRRLASLPMKWLIPVLWCGKRRNTE